MIELVLRVVLSLAAVLGLLWFLARMSSRRMGGTRGSVLNVVGRQSLGRTASMAVVTAGSRVLVVGVSEHGVRLLTELDPDEVEQEAPAIARADADRLTSEEDAVAIPPARPALTGSGSVLSAQTWRQAWSAVTSKNGATG